MQKEKYIDYVRILKEELIPAMGCTEPIALAYASSLCERTLGELPQKCSVKVSGNLIKNLAYLLEVKQMDLPVFRDGVRHEPVDPARFENNLQSRRRSPDPEASYHSHNWNKPVWKYEVVH